MKKILGLVCLLGTLLIAGSAFAGTATIAYWQHGFNQQTFISLTNVGASTITYTITLKKVDGSTVLSTTSTLAAGAAIGSVTSGTVGLDTGFGFEPTGGWTDTSDASDNLGFGTITGSIDSSLVAWAVVWGNATANGGGGMPTGFTVTINGGSAF